MIPPTPLELLLPIGRASNAAVLGDGAPERLCRRTGDAPFDLVMVAPTRDEAARPGWIDEAITRAIASVSPAGVIYLMLPPAERRRAASRLRDSGSTSHTSFLHHPGFDQIVSLVPGNRTALRRWLEQGEGPASVRRRLTTIALAVPAADRLATTLLPSVGIAARRPETPAPFHWLSRLSGARVAHGLLRAKWRGERAGAVVTGLDEAGRSVVVAKIPLGGAQADLRAAREADRLEQLGPAARKAGAQLPTPQRAELSGGWPILLLSPLPGRPAARFLASRALSPDAVIAQLGEWLVRWHEVTMTPGRLDQRWTECELLAPAVRLGADLPDADGYLRFLRDRAAEATGEPLPTVATHGDLTMSNVLLGDGAPGVVDWEASSATGVPLRDLLYAAVDATAAGDGYRDRLGAFLRCFPDGTGAVGALGRLLEQLRRVTGLTEATMTLCVHACWLQHAADEQAKRASNESRPFLAIVQHLAERARAGHGAR